MEKGIFKAYDIRGIYPRELDEDAAYRIARAFVRFLGCKKVVVGYDMRESSPGLFEALSKGLADEGAKVLDIGLCSTPMCYFANHHLRADASIMITASHNPIQYNGLKLCREGALPLSGDTGIDKIRDLAMKADFKGPAGAGSVGQVPGITDDYIAFVRKILHKGGGWNRPVRVVADFANGMGSLEAEALKDPMLEIIPLFEELDGSFPNHEANPLKTETLQALQEKVTETGAMMGIAFDGDADRVGFVDEKGEIVPMDIAMTLLAEEILEERPGSTVLYDLRSTRAFKEAVEAKGGRALLSRVGHSFIKQEMRKEGAVFAGELAGHYYFLENSYAESTALAAGRLISLVQREGRPLSEMAARLRKYFHSGELNSEVGDKDAVLRELESKFSDGKVSHLDGLLVEYDDWWFNVRASNTEPLLRLNLEAKSREKMEKMKGRLLSIIRKERKK